MELPLVRVVTVSFMAGVLVGTVRRTPDTRRSLDTSYILYYSYTVAISAIWSTAMVVAQAAKQWFLCKFIVFCLHVIENLFLHSTSDPHHTGPYSRHLPCLQSVDIQIEITYECIRPDTFFHMKNALNFCFRFVMCPNVRIWLNGRYQRHDAATAQQHCYYTLNVQYMAHKLMAFDAYTPLKMQKKKLWTLAEKHTSLEIGRAPPIKISISMADYKSASP